MKLRVRSCTDTPPLTDEQRAQKKADKKARKEARRAAAAEADASKQDDAMEVEEAPVKEKKDKKEKKEKKDKKDKKRKLDEDEAAPVEAAKEDAAPEASGEGDEEPKKKKKKRKNVQGAFGNAIKTAAEAATDAVAAETTSTPIASTSSTPAPAPKIVSTSTPAEVSTFLTANRVSHEPESAVTDFPPVLSFAALPLEDSLRKGLAAFTTPTPIQSASFPVMMGGRDVIGIAETGSGKTVAFGVPAISHILSLPATGKKGKAPISVLVVAPTRELAMQTHDNLAKVASNIPNLTATCIYGGVSKDDQKKVLRTGPRIVVGTPGRLLDLANEGALDLSHVSWLVLDEADRMLDKGFENDIREIIKQCLPLPASPLAPIGAANSAPAPVARMTCMFSATWPTSVRKLASDFMCSPVKITVGADELTANKRVDQSVTVLDDGRQKEQRLLGVLRDHGFTKGGVKKGGGIGKDREKALVFALYKKEATRVTEFLERNGFEVGCIQGDMTQEKRSKSLQDFKDGRVSILVATDVAARGLDIPKVELVINQTFPLTIEDYIHRIGRTGRAGRTGKSVTFFTEADKAHAGELIRVLKDGGFEVPEAMYQWGTTIKKATHSSYGAHFRDDIKGTAKKIKF
ncbi:ATP-dependent rrna helicase rrp3 [Pseudohyphozyma bogoriensis]|nr:ATP-dependent rrna helicase rrp3 [Pseudohyphozyma bogoriensis]